MGSDIDEILKLSVEERLEIVDWIWESLKSNNENAEIPEWHKVILHERLQKYETTLTEGKS